MHSTLTRQETDPHDAFAIEPEIVLAARTHQESPDPVHEVLSLLSRRRAQTASGVSAGAATPTVDTTFRATAADIRVPTIHVGSDRPAGRSPSGSRAKRAVTVFLFALCSALAAAGWQHYGAAARQMISAWTPPFALTSSPPTEKTGLTGQPDAPAVQAFAADQAPPQNPTAAQPPEGTAPAPAAPSPDAEQLQSMARDLAAMGQQIEQLKASIAELKAGQQAMARDLAKPSEAKPSDIKPSEVKPLVQNPRPKISAPPRSAAAPSRRPMPAYAPAQAAAPPPPPQQLPPPTSLRPMPPPPAAAQPEDEPVVRPPMPLR
jgi:hypothetical protein